MATPPSAPPISALAHPEVASPCVRRCTLNEADVCVGCGRTLDDIRCWRSMTEPDKAACVARARQRLAAMGRPLPPL